MWITALTVLLGGLTVSEGYEEILLVVDGNNVIRSNASGYQLDYVITGVVGIQDLDFDLITDTLYWTTSGKIQKAYIGGEPDPSTVEVEDFITTDTGYLDSVAVDWLNRKLYWTDTGRGQISVVGLHGSGREVIVTGISSPHKIVVDPYKGNLYWIDKGNTSQTPSSIKLETSKLDGSGRAVFMGDELIHPTALAIDYSDPRMIYWADTGKNNIQTSGSSGWSRHVVVSNQVLYNGEKVVQSTGSLTIGSQYMYWTEPHRHLIFYTQKQANSEVEAIPGNFVQPTSVHVFHDYRQPVDKCSLPGGCNADVHVCTDDPSGPYLCSCKPGTEYNETLQKCVNIDECHKGIDKCHHTCTDNDGSYVCGCVSGYKLVNVTNCEDMDECDANQHQCEHICNNVVGSYVCSCRQGYRLQPDGLKCQLITCDNPLTYHNVIVDCGSGPFAPGHACILGCDSGRLFGPTTVFCGQTGNWLEPAEIPFCYGGTSPEISWNALSIQVTPNAVAENSPFHTIVGHISLQVPEVYGQLPLQSLQFSLVTTGVPFTVENTSTQAGLKLTGPADYEKQSVYNITLQADFKYNDEQQTIRSQVKIYIGDVNEPPSKPQLSRYSIPETFRIGGVVARFVTTDPDRSGTDPNKMQRLEYTLLSTVDSKGQSVSLFDAEDNSGIVLWGHLDYEQNPYYTITIKVQDTGIPPLSATSQVNITVFDVNEPPTDILLSNTQMYEMSLDQWGEVSPAAVMIGTLTAIDPDDPGNEKHSYQVVKDDVYDHHMDCFKVTNTTLSNGTNAYALYTSNPDCFNYEKFPLLQTTLEVKDKYGLTFQKTFDITVKDINERPSDIFITGSRVLEHSPVGMVIGMVFVRDPDVNDSYTLSLLSSTNDWISLTGSSLKVSGDIDYEQERTIVVTLRATDKSGLQLTKNVTVTVENVRHGPKIDLKLVQDYQCDSDTEVSACVPENVPGNTVVAMVNVSDTEENKTVTMWLTDSTRSFKLSGNKISVKPNKLNYESDVQNIVVKLTAIDKQGDMSVQTMIVKVLNANDKPKEVLLSNTILSSDVTVGETVGKLTCVDEDYDDNHNFTLKKNPGDLFSLEGNLLKISKPLDGNEFPITLTCTDGIERSKSSHFTIEKSTDPGTDIRISLSHNVVLESLAVGAVIGTINISSEQSHNIFHVTLEDEEYLPFKTTATSSTTAVLKLTEPLNYEDKTEYNIVIKALSLITNGIAFKNFVIKVLNVPEEIDMARVLFKECPPDTWVTEVSVLDPAPNTVYNFSIVTSALPLKFTDGTNTSAILRNFETLDYEDEQMGRDKEFNVTIQVMDTSNTLIKVMQTYTVRILNINEAPYNVTLTSRTVLENTSPRSVVSQLIVHDPDLPVTNQKFFCDFVRNDFGWFQIDNSLKLKVQKDAVIDYEHPKFPLNSDRHVDHLVFECWDQGGLSFISEPLELEIQDVNEAPTDIDPSNKLNVAENLPAGTRQYIGSFSVTDEDKKDRHELLIEPRNSKHPYPPGLFVFTGSKLYVTESLNFENRSSYKVKVTATDQGGLSLIKKFQIYVLDMNDPPTNVFVPSYAHILENQPAFAVLTYLYTEDEDFDQGHTYTILHQSPINALQVIDNNKLAVLNPEVLDFEKYKFVDLTVQSVDKGVPSMNITKNITIPISNVQEAPTAIVLSSNYVNEGAPTGTVVGNVTIVDPDGNLTSSFFYFVILTDSAGGRFAVDFNWDIDAYQLVVNSGEDALNYEKQSYHNITLFTIDFGHTLSSTIVIHLIDQNDPPKGMLFKVPQGQQVPTEPDMTAFPSMTQEDIGGTVLIPESAGLSEAPTWPIAYMYVVDEDMLHNTVDMNNYRFTISAEPPHNPTGLRRRREVNGRIKRMTNPKFTSPAVSSFSVLSQSGSMWLALWSNLTLDYEAQSQYEMYITCTDTTSTGMSVTQKVTLMVQDVEEPPYSVSLDNNTVKENSDRSIKIGTLRILDQDTVPVYLVSVVPTPHSPFYMSGMDLYTRKMFDFEEKSSYLLNISLAEVGVTLGSPYYYNIEVFVVDQPESPCCLSFNDTSNNRKVISSSVTNGDTVGILGVSDPDLADEKHIFQFEVYSAKFELDDYTSYFKVINHNELIIAKQLPDTSTQAIYEIIIRTEDSSGLGYKDWVYVSFLGGCDGKQCHKSATCTKVEDGTSICKCNEGFTGNGEGCSAINACEKSPCLNDGECFHGSRGSYICNCSAEFTGLNCEVPRSQCDGVRCPYNGICVPLEKSYYCQCSDPYRRDCSGCIHGVFKNGICVSSTEGTNDKVTAEQSDKGMPSYVPVVIAVVVVVILIAIITAVVVYLRKTRHVSIHRRMRYDSDGNSSLNVISGEMNFKDGTEPSQFANPLYDRASISTNGGVYPSESKVVPDDLDPTTVNLDVNENPPEVTRTLSQQEEIWFNDNKESSS